MRTAAMLAVLLTSFLQPDAGVAQSQSVNPATICVNGFRTTHVVRSRGRDHGGVLLRCRR